jgi:hypothetical protein
MIPAWSDVRMEFQFDGSWRDIYIIRTTISDWQLVIDALRDSPFDLQYKGSGVPTTCPASARDAFPGPGCADRLLSVDAGGVALNCHFFNESEIEFDFDPRQVTGQDQLNAVLSFMQLISRACDKEAVLTPENARDATIFRVRPRTLRVEYVRCARPFGSA